MKIGYIGLGNIGLDMARELVKSGQETVVFDVMSDGPAELASLGAQIAHSPAEVAANADVICVCVRTAQQVLDVIDGENGILTTARPGTLIAVHSTVRPQTIHAAAELANARGVRLIDAPVSRGAIERQGKTIVYMVSGAEADVELATPFFEPSAKQIIVAGALGAATALKLCNNLVVYLQFLAASEADKLAKRCNLDPALLLSVMTHTGDATPSMQAMMTNRLAMTDDLTGSARLAFEGFAAIAEKDLDCALEAGRDVGLDLPGTQLARQQIRAVYLDNRE